jgi:hypothetical protein
MLKECESGGTEIAAIARDRRHRVIGKAQFPPAFPLVCFSPLPFSISVGLLFPARHAVFVLPIG